MTYPRLHGWQGLPDLLKGMASSIAMTLLMSLAACHQPAPEADGTLPSSGNTVSVSLSQSGEVQAFAGISRSITLTFSSSDGATASDLALNLASLPEGWRSLSSGPTFHCMHVARGRHAS